jgi:hypothetical protein
VWSFSCHSNGCCNSFGVLCCIINAETALFCSLGLTSLFNFGPLTVFIIFLLKPILTTVMFSYVFHCFVMVIIENELI